VRPAQGGKPTMTPEAENEAGIDVLKGGAQTRSQVLARDSSGI